MASSVSTNKISHGYSYIGIYGWRSRNSRQYWFSLGIMNQANVDVSNDCSECAARSWKFGGGFGYPSTRMICGEVDDCHLRKYVRFPILACIERQRTQTGHMDIACRVRGCDPGDCLRTQPIGPLGLANRPTLSH